MRYKMKLLAIPVLILPAIAVLGFAVMELWNLVMPAVFDGSHAIDFYHALGLLILCRILFGGFRGRGGWHRKRHWDKWASMTREERERFLGSRS